MKVYVFPADVHGCGHYRMIWPAEELKRRGYDVILQRPNERVDLNAEIKGDTIVNVHVPKDADVMVFQRVTHKFLAAAIPLIRAKGIAVVVDMDDNLSHIDPRNPAFLAMHPQNRNKPSPQGEHTWHHAQTACDVATHVTVSSDALMRQYGRHGRCTIIRNAVHDAMLETPHVDSTTFGYPGSVLTHFTDVSQLGFSVARLMSDGYQFMTIGEDVHIERLLGTPRSVDIAYGPVSLQDWPLTLAKLGVGLAPLAKSKFNDAKSWLKPLELAAVGVPCVMSPSPEYARIHADGIGDIARKPRDFYTKIKRLLDDTVYRNEMSAQAREVARMHTISRYADYWLDAWSQAYATEQAS